jgi:nuclear transport factor 2 (NTF2) superfamily protein
MFTVNSKRTGLPLDRVRAFSETGIAVRYAYASGIDDSGNWFRSYGNENWEFDGLLRSAHHAHPASCFTTTGR